MRKSECQAAWQRLVLIIEASGLTVSAFARQIGLPRSENLYQIRRGNNRISRALAQRIHDTFPQYPVAWLICGESETVGVGRGAAPAARLPVYRNLPAAAFPPKGKPDGYLLLSTAQAGRAQLAVPAANQVPGGGVQELLVLLRAPQEEFAEGKVYLVVTGRQELLRTVQPEPHDPQRLRLSAAFGAVAEEQVVRRSEIGALWPVCGVVCRME